MSNTYKCHLTWPPVMLRHGIYQLASAVIHVSVGPSSTEPRSTEPRSIVAHDQPSTCPFSCQSHPYLKWFDMKHACPCFACVQIASWLFIRYIHFMMSLPTCAPVAIEMRQELENAMTYVNQQTTLHHIKLRSGMLFFIA